ncbi:MAG: hypothetical protein QM705_00210 [Ancrocorticia sp.]
METKDWARTEIWAKNFAADTIGSCEHLDPQFEANDRTPFTDGHIDVYKSGSYKKTEFAGRVYVQIKGKSMKKSAKKLKSYSIELSALRGFLELKGVLYLVVTRNNQGKRRYLHYVLLNPSKIKEILDRAKDGQREISVTVRRFPSNCERAERIVNLALKASDEKPYQVIDPVLFQNAKQFTIYTDQDALDFSTPLQLNYENLDYVLTLTTSGGMEIPLPGELQIVPGEYVSRESTLTLSCGEVVFENPICRRLDRERVEFKLSDGLSFLLRESRGKISANLTLVLQSNLAARIRDVTFYLSCVETRRLTFNGRIAELALGASGDIDSLQKQYRMLQRLENFFMKVGVDPILIEFDDLDDETLSSLDILYKAVIDGELISRGISASGGVLLKIGSWDLRFFAIEDRDSVSWQVYDWIPYGVSNRLVRKPENTSDRSLFLPATPYEAFDAAAYAKTLNLHLEMLVEAYRTIVDSPQTTEIANRTVLELISAADMEPRRRDELLGAALTLNNWLIGLEPEEPHHLINRSQIEARHSPLSKGRSAEVRALKRRAIRGDVAQPALIEACCAILIGGEGDVLEAISQLSSEEGESITKWPIWTLYENRKGVTSGVISAA